MRWIRGRVLCVPAAALALTLALSGCGATALITAQGPVAETSALPGGLDAAQADSAAEAPAPDGQAVTAATEEAPAAVDAAEESAALTVGPGLLTAETGSAAQAMAIWAGLQQLRQTVLDHPVRLAVPNILQNPELPNGCEITSAAILLNYLGVPADKITLAEKYLPKGENHLTADPEREFMGSPFAGEVGYYCMPAPVAAAVNAYLADIGNTGLQAQDISGADITALEEYLHKGMPVLVWVTQHFAEPSYAGHFVLPDGSQPYVNLHCVVLTGYDDDKFYLTDPLAQSDSQDHETFTSIYEAMGRRALVIVPREQE